MKINKYLLENKSIDDLLKCIRERQKHIEVFCLIEEFLTENNIRNYYDLALLITNRDKFRQMFINRYKYELGIAEMEAFTYNYLYSIIYRLNEFNFTDYDSYIFECCDVFDPTYELTDKKNTLNDLWFQSPINIGTNQQFNNLSIATVKNALRNIDVNSLENPLFKYGIEAKTARMIIKSLKPYTEQVIRQSIELGEIAQDTNLLKVNRKEKRCIVSIVFDNVSNFS